MNGRKYAWFLTVGGAGALLLAACGGTEPSGAGGSGTSSSTGAGGGTTSSTGTGGGATHYACDNRSSESTCADFWDSATKEVATASCDGVVLEMPCPLDKAVGICKIVANNGETLTNTYYSDGATPWTAATASAACTKAMGTFQMP